MKLIVDKLGLIGHVTDIHARRLPRFIDRDDVRGVVFLRVVKDTPHFDPAVSTYGNFLSIRIRGAVVDAVRAQCVGRTRFVKGALLSLNFCDLEQDENLAESKERSAAQVMTDPYPDAARLLAIAARALDAQQSAVVYLYFLQDQPMREVAKVLR
ncbi:MAG: hypothetical protein ACREMY_01780, partial [bacterium]